MKKLHELCKAENSEDLIARVYPQLNKIFHRSVASISQSRMSNGLLLLVLIFLILAVLVNSWNLLSEIHIGGICIRPRLFVAFCVFN